MTSVEFRRLQDLKSRMILVCQSHQSAEIETLKAQMEFEIRVLEYKLHLQIEEMAQSLFEVGLKNRVMRVAKYQTLCWNMFWPEVIEEEPARTGDPIQDVWNIKHSAYKLATNAVHQQLGRP